MADSKKSDQILDALQQLMIDKSIQNISVSDIAAKAGIGKGSIYYYFPSKEAILDALIRRNYENPLQTAKSLADQTNIPPFTRMAMLFQACRSSAAAFLKQGSEKTRTITIQESAYLHQKYLNYLISELKPNLAKIIRQGIEAGEIHFDYPEALAEIVLIVLAVKFDNSLLPSTPQETEETLRGLVALLEKGTDVAAGTLSYLTLAPYIS